MNQNKNYKNNNIKLVNNNINLVKNKVIENGKIVAVALRNQSPETIYQYLKNKIFNPIINIKNFMALLLFKPKILNKSFIYLKEVIKILVILTLLFLLSYLTVKTVINYYINRLSSNILMFIFLFYSFFIFLRLILAIHEIWFTSNLKNIFSIFINKNFNSINFILIGSVYTPYIHKISFILIGSPYTKIKLENISLVVYKPKIIYIIIFNSLNFILIGRGAHVYTPPMPKISFILIGRSYNKNISIIIYKFKIISIIIFNSINFILIGNVYTPKISFILIGHAYNKNISIIIYKSNISIIILNFFHIGSVHTDYIPKISFIHISRDKWTTLSKTEDILANKTSTHDNDDDDDEYLYDNISSISDEDLDILSNNTYDGFQDLSNDDLKTYNNYQKFSYDDIPSSIEGGSNFLFSNMYNSLSKNFNPEYQDINSKNQIWLKWVYNVNGTDISRGLVSKILKKFWLEIIDPLNDKDSVIFQWILNGNKLGIKSFSTIQIIQKSDILRLKEVLIAYLDETADHYEGDETGEDLDFEDENTLWQESIFWYSQLNESNIKSITNKYKKNKNQNFPNKKIKVKSHSDNNNSLNNNKSINKNNINTLTPLTSKYFINKKRIISIQAIDSDKLISIDFITWGEIIEESKENNYIIIKKFNSDHYFKIELNSDKNINIVSRITKYGDITDIWIDKIINNDSYTFVRYYHNPNEKIDSKNIKKEFYSKGKLVYYEQYKKVNFMSQCPVEESLSTKFLTMDIETKLINNLIVPRCISLYDGNTKKLYQEYFDVKKYPVDTVKHIFYDIFQKLLVDKYDKHYVFLHNISRFDIVFMLDKIIDLVGVDNLDIIKKDDKWINITVKYGKNKRIIFRDSILNFPISLEKLSNINIKDIKSSLIKINLKGLDLESWESNINNITKKGHFPFQFFNLTNVDLDYIGNVPNIEYFNNINDIDYDIYCKRFKNKKWNLKNELLNYNKDDVISLWDVIIIFNEINFKIFKLNIINNPTLPSNAIKIFRAHYLKEYTIPLITSDIWDFISQSYYGGDCQNYKVIGTNLFMYDVVSLYPYIIKNYEIPVGKPVYFEGNPTDYVKIKDKIFFAQVEVIVPKNISNPILPWRSSNNDETNRIITPFGNWTGIYSSYDILIAKNAGYKIKYLKGYYYKKIFLFDDYVNIFQKIKLNSRKEDFIYTYSKLFINSLYGKFGISPDLIRHKFIKLEDLLHYSKTYSTVLQFIVEGKDIAFISFKDKEHIKSNTKLNISIPIASSITAGARNHISQFKLNKNFTIYYTDTDSIVISSKLNKKYVGSKLGIINLERVFTEAVFIAPKIYGGLLMIPVANSELKEYKKIKGLVDKNKVSYYDLKELTKKDSFIKVSNTKWKINIEIANIEIKDFLYTIKATRNKGHLIYNDKTELLESIKPFTVKDGKIIKD